MDITDRYKTKFQELFDEQPRLLHSCFFKMHSLLYEGVSRINLNTTIYHRNREILNDPNILH